MSADYENLLISLCYSYGIEISRKQSVLLLRHLNLVLMENQHINLTSIINIDDALILHILDSLLLVPYVAEYSNLIIDMGTGAGYPGVPLAITIAKKSILIDSVRKKIDVLQKIINKLEINNNVEAIAIRIENYSQEHIEEASCVVARAVAPLDVLIEYSSPLLSKGGRLIATKGPKKEIDDTTLAKVSKMCGMRMVSRETFELPSMMGTRCIYCFEKIEQPLIALPRRDGIALKRPLRNYI